MSDIFVLNKEDKDFNFHLKRIRQAVPLLCKQAVSKEYIDVDDNEYKFLIVAYSKGSERSKNKPTTIIGFMLMTELEENKLEVTIICVGNHFREKAKDDSKGLGNRLFQHLYSLCKKHDYNVIQLSALPYVINYYRKMGFRHILEPKCYGKDREPTKIKHLAEAFAKENFTSDDDVKMRIKIDKTIQLHIQLNNNKKEIRDLDKLTDTIKTLIEGEISDKKRQMEFLDYYKKSRRTFGENKTITFFETLVKEGFSSECDATDRAYRTRQWLDETEDPRCIDEGIIMSKCLDVKPRIIRAKCPNGTRKNKATGRCEKTVLKKRCPNGTRKNKATGRCEKIKNKK